MCLSRPPATHDEQNLDRSARTSAGPTPTSPASACATTASKAAATARSSLLSRHIVRMEKRLAEESACEHRDRPRSPEIARDHPRSPETEETPHSYSPAGRRTRAPRKRRQRRPWRRGRRAWRRRSRAPCRGRGATCSRPVCVNGARALSFAAGGQTRTLVTSSLVVSLGLLLGLHLGSISAASHPTVEGDRPLTYCCHSGGWRRRLLQAT